MGEEQMVTVRLTVADSEQGFSILLHAGTVVYHSNDRTYTIPMSSLLKLQAANIRFTIVR
jgi:hypothetical protein